MEEFISDELLISAYDVHYGTITSPFDFASIIFLDSGGYEASKEYELSETFEGEHRPKEWTIDLYTEVIKKWASNSPTVFVSFDHPKHRLPIKEQILRANQLPLPNGNHARALLIKPETEESKRVRVESILENVSAMTGFAAIGVTEKEIGNSLLSRMMGVARLRQGLTANNLDTPIHVFGSLDTISTYLYFLAGADIFDGLSWLRYAFTDGDTVYRHLYGALELPINLNSDIVEARCWSNNLQYMQQMRLNMVKFIADHNFSHFGKHAELIENAFQSMNAEIAGD